MSKQDTDIFGESTEGKFDTSDAALEGKWEPSSQPAAEEEPPPADEEPAEESIPSGNGDEEPADDEPKEEEPSFELPTDLQGKSVEDLAKIIAEKRSFEGRQSNELGDLRKKFEEQQQIIAAMQAAQEAEGFDPDYIETPQDALAAYRGAIEALDTGRADIADVEEIIEAAHSFDPLLAVRMSRDLGMRLARAEIMAQMEPVQQFSRESILNAASSELYSEDEDTSAYQADVVRIVKQPQTLAERQLSQAYAQAQSKQEIKEILSAALNMARGADATRSKAYKTKLVATKQNSQVETGNAEAQEPLSDEEKTRRSIFATRANAAGDIFANFAAK